jgi:hypothetical protein
MSVWPRPFLKMFRTTRELLNVRHFPTVILCNNDSWSFDDEIKGVLAFADVRLIIFLSHSSLLFETLDSLVFGSLKKDKREIITKPCEEFHVWSITKLMQELDHLWEIFTSFVRSWKCIQKSFTSFGHSGNVDRVNVRCPESSSLPEKVRVFDQDREWLWGSTIGRGQTELIRYCHMNSNLWLYASPTPEKHQSHQRGRLLTRWEKQLCKYLAKLKNKMTREVAWVNISQSAEQWERKYQENSHDEWEGDTMDSIWSMLSKDWLKSFLLWFEWDLNQLRDQKWLTLYQLFSNPLKFAARRERTSRLALVGCSARFRILGEDIPFFDRLLVLRPNFERIAQ